MYENASMGLIDSTPFPPSPHPNKNGGHCLIFVLFVFRLNQISQQKRKTPNSFKMSWPLKMNQYLNYQRKRKILKRQNRLVIQRTSTKLEKASEKVRYLRAQIFPFAPPQFFSCQVFSKNTSLFNAVYKKKIACLALAICGISWVVMRERDTKRIRLLLLSTLLATRNGEFAHWFIFSSLDLINCQPETDLCRLL